MSRWRNEDMYVVGDEIVGEDEIGALRAATGPKTSTREQDILMFARSVLQQISREAQSGDIRRVNETVAMYLTDIEAALIQSKEDAIRAAKEAGVAYGQQTASSFGARGFGGGMVPRRPYTTTTRAPAKPSFFKLFG